MEKENPLYARVDASNTETPRACHIIALRLADSGLAIPDDVREAVIKVAERGDAMLANLIQAVNDTAANESAVNFNVRENFLRLAAQISFSFGLHTKDAFLRRLNNLYDSIQVEEPSEGVGFTE
jgi:hypothetical protein